MSDFIIRSMSQSESALLKEFTYLAIYVPNGAEKPDKGIVERPELNLYYQDFGTKRGDVCLVAETNQKVVGAAWTRLIHDFAHLDDATPSLAIAVVEENRGKGIGTSLLTELLATLRKAGFSAVSLSVQRGNFAGKLYERAGFKVVKENGDERVMRKKL